MLASANLNKKSCWLFLFLLKKSSYEHGKLGIYLCYTLIKLTEFRQMSGELKSVITAILASVLVL